MKKALLCLLAIASFTSLLAQTPHGFSYQSVIRDGDGNLAKNATFDLTVSILKGSENGTPVYTEYHSDSTNENGLLSIIIGHGESNTNISSISWGNDAYYVKIETTIPAWDILMSATTQLMSVPYALHAQSAKELDETLVIPQSGKAGETVIVSFSGGNNVTFSQATPVVLRFMQATPVFPNYVSHISENRIDAEFTLPFIPATSTYNIIFNPESENESESKHGFNIYW